MSIRSVPSSSLPRAGVSQRLVDNGGRLPFSAVDTNGEGRVSKQELINAVRLNFPGLTDLEAKAIGHKAFDAGAKGKFVDAAGWAAAERVVLDEAAITLKDKAPGETAVEGPVETPELPPAAWQGQTPSKPALPSAPATEQVLEPEAPPPLYQPRQDDRVTGQQPYQRQPPAELEQQPGVSGAAGGETIKKGRAAGRTLLGFLKMLPVVGNVLNGIDFLRDVGKVATTWLDPRRGVGEKVKAGADLLFHGAGMFVPQLGGAYDIAQGITRLGASAARSEGQKLPPYRFDPGAYPPVQPMPNAQPAAPEEAEEAAEQAAVGRGSSPGASPALAPYQQRQPELSASEQETVKKGRATGRTMLGFLKMLPIVGNVLNGIDFLRDVGKAATTWLDPRRGVGEKLKAGADLLFHGAGMFVPQLGGAYDIAQGIARLGASAARTEGQKLPPYGFDDGGYPPVQPMPNVTPAEVPEVPEAPEAPPAAKYDWQASEPSAAPETPAQADPMAKAARGTVRFGLGALKLLPVVGNLLNGVDFLRDLGKASVTWVDPRRSGAEKLKAGTDLLAHGAGVFVPQIGAVYDMAQGAARVGGAYAEAVLRAQQSLPEYRFDGGGYPPVYDMQHAQ